MVKVFISGEYTRGYYGVLTGRWYISALGSLFLEVEEDDGKWWPFTKTSVAFQHEDKVREICGDYDK